MQQNFDNHIRYNRIYHFIAVPLLLIAIGIATCAFIYTPDLTHALILFAMILTSFAAGFSRYFALRVQDRAARADERLRYYILTEKMLPIELRMGQILALRFASDEEFPILVGRTLTENLQPIDIKKSIKNWRGDYHRI